MVIISRDTISKILSMPMPFEASCSGYLRGKVYDTNPSA